MPSIPSSISAMFTGALALSVISGSAHAQNASLSPDNVRSPYASTPVLRPVKNPAELQLVDPRHDDIGPLALSLKDLQPDLRQPSGFDKIYRVGNHNPRGDDRFARVSGALAAVFNRSEYTSVKTKKGGTRIRIDVPAGTIYYIGGIPNDQRKWGFDAASSKAKPRGNDSAGAEIVTKADTAAPTRIDPYATPGAPSSPGPLASEASAPRGLAQPAPTQRTPSPTDRPTAPGNPTRAIETSATRQHAVTPTDHAGMITDDAYRVQRIRTLLQQAAAPK